MKNKIVLKLTLYFTIALLVFALIISSIFISLFRRNTIELNKTELEQRATKISETLSPIMSGVSKMQGGGYGAYIKFLNDIAMADVWIVDENLNIITSGQGMHAQYSFSELPKNAESIVKEVFTGRTAYSESFSSLLDTPVITVGVPILSSSNDEIIGVVLLHSPVTGINTAISKGIFILILSIGAALIIAIALSIGFSIGFTKPLNKMNKNAIKLAEGDYLAKNNINQNDEIGTLANNLDILSEKLYLSSKESEKLEQLRRDFVANISHELRTPITVIRGSLEALKDEIVTEETQVKEYHKQMLNESINLQRLVSDLLDLSRLQNTEFKIEMSEVNICDIVSDVIRSAKNLALTKNIELLVENSASNCSVQGDYGRIRQMFMTIIDNAIKFSPQDGHIYITLYQNDSLNVSIRDEGIGIEEEDLPYLFDRFYKTKAVENTNGTGLGLSIAKQIAIRHNAQIRVNSVKGKWSEFLVRFPL